MISAKDALQLPTAQLSEKELEEVEKLEEEIEKVVKTKMERHGCDVRVETDNGNIIAELNQRFKRVGYLCNWQPIVEQHRINKALSALIGYKLQLVPSDDAYRPSVH